MVFYGLHLNNQKLLFSPKRPRRSLAGKDNKEVGRFGVGDDEDGQVGAGDIDEDDGQDGATNKKDVRIKNWDRSSLCPTSVFLM